MNNMCCSHCPQVKSLMNPLFTFRFNMYIKQLVRDVHRPEENLVRTTAQDVAVRFLNLTQSELRELSRAQCHECVLSYPVDVVLKTSEIDDLRMYHNSNVIDHYDVQGFKVAHIMSVHFRSGSWPSYPRCGAVVTCVLGGPGRKRRSLFARVNFFFKVRADKGPGYASVSWFGEPEYIYRDNPLGVKCREDGSGVRDEVGSVVRITQIDPSQIMVEHEVETGFYVMIRDSGYNTRPN